MSITQETIQNQIFTIRGKQVMLDRDLSVLYGIDTRILNQAVKRNINKFPDNFRHQLSDSEQAELITICDRFKILKHSASLMYAYSESGVAMLSAVLKSETAVRISIQIINSFVSMRKAISDNAFVFQRLDKIEQKYLLLQYSTDEKFEQIFDALQSNDLKPKQGYFTMGRYLMLVLSSLI